MLRKAIVLTTAAVLLPAAAAGADTGPTSAPARVARVGGKLVIRFHHPLLYRKQPFGIVGHGIEARAVMSRYVANQVVRFTVTRDGKRVVSKRVPLRRSGPHGVAVLRFDPKRTGLLRFRAVHRGTPLQARAAAKVRKVNVRSYAVNFGSRGAVVDLIQRRLIALHYRAYETGTFDGATGRALLAYRKVNNLPRAQYAGRYVVGQLIRERGAFHAKYPSHGRHVEADLSRQVIALINPGGKVYKTFPISSGKPSTPTVLGHYRFYLKTPGTNSEGMVDSNYFIRGYAIHGYPSVPDYAASHGCLRTFIADAGFIYGWIRLGDGIDVYP